jgi:uncharacterized lipoprotein NlpE involved in copper resistance
MKYWITATIAIVAAFILFGCSGTESSTATDPGSKDQGSIQGHGAVIDHGDSYTSTTLDCEGNPVDMTIADNSVIHVTTNNDG